MTKTSAAAAVTIAWLLAGALLVILKFEPAKSMSLNELGDFMAGFFSPVAFLWLVVGYFQQGEELKLNTKALELQANELKQSVEQQKELVEVTRADMAITKMAYELEAEREIRKAQPILQLSTNSYNSSYDGITVLESILINDGHSCTSITISCNEGSLSQTEIAAMLNGSKKVIKYSFPTPTNTFSTHISYLDGVGVKRRTVIEAVRNEAGSLLFLPAKEATVEYA